MMNGKMLKVLLRKKGLSFSINFNVQLHRKYARIKIPLLSFFLRFPKFHMQRALRATYGT